MAVACRGIRPASGLRKVAALLAAGAMTATVLSGCAAFGSDRSGIVVTTNILGDVVDNVVGDAAEVTVLMDPDADPHSFGVSAQEAALMEKAELLVHNGMGLEEGVLRHVAAAEEAGVEGLAVGEHVDPIEYVDGETAGEPDPHFWTDPLRMQDAVDVIAEHVAEHVDGVDPDQMQSHADEYRGEIEQLHEDSAQLFADVPDDRRKLVTNHHVFGYLAQRYDFEVIGAVIPSGASLASPSGSDVKDLADAIDDAGVPAIFVDSSQPDRLAQTLAEETDIDVEVVSLYTESLSAQGEEAATYLQMGRFNAESIAEGLTDG